MVREVQFNFTSNVFAIPFNSYTEHIHTNTNSLRHVIHRTFFDFFFLCLLPFDLNYALHRITRTSRIVVDFCSFDGRCCWLTMMVCWYSWSTYQFMFAMVFPFLFAQKNHKKKNKTNRMKKKKKIKNRRVCIVFTRQVQQWN